MRSRSASSIRRLVQYLRDDQGKEGRVVDLRFSNVACEDDPDFCLAEMARTQETNQRSKADKTYHLVVSFREGEMPAPDVLRAIEAAFAEGLGYGEHQRVCIVHGDTDNPHFHLAINKVHPVKYTVHEPYYDKKTLGRLCEGLEVEHGLEHDNHTPKTPASRAGAMDMERAGGMESLSGWIQRECAERLKEAASWHDLHEILAEHGLELQERGNGLVIGNGENFVKASAVDRALSKGRLEERLGTYQAEAGVAAKQEEKEPGSSLYDAFLLDRTAARSAKMQELTAAREVRDREIRRQQEWRQAQRTLLRGALFGGIIMRLSRMVADAKIKAAQQWYAAEKEKIFAPSPGGQWADWVQEQAKNGNKEALEHLRSKRAASLLGGIQRTCGERLQGADSWRELHAILAEHGLELKARGNGLVIVSGEDFVKASAVDRALSKGQLEGRLGTYQAAKAGDVAGQEAAKTYTVKPLDNNVPSNPLYDAFLRDKEAARAVKMQLAAIREARDREIRRQQKWRQAQTALLRKALFGDILLRLSRAVADAKIKAAEQWCATEKAKLSAPLPSGKWKDWLQEQAKNGNEEALAFLRSRRTEPSRGEMFTGKARQSYAPVPQSVSSKGTRIFAGGIRETDEAIQMQDAPDKLAEGLRMAAEKFDGPLHVHGGRDFEQRAVRTAVDEGIKVSFFDKNLEARRIYLEDSKQHTESIIKYINSRNLLQGKVSDIQEHRLFDESLAGRRVFAGIRTQDDYHMALFRHKGGVFVLPITSAMAKNLRGLRLGTPLVVSSRGTITLPEQDRPKPERGGLSR
jgi:hypothetical protein